AEGDFHADGFARRDRVNLFHGEVHFLEDVQHLAAHIARGADNGHPVTHRSSPHENGASPYPLGRPRARRANLTRLSEALRWRLGSRGATRAQREMEAMSDASSTSAPRLAGTPFSDLMGVEVIELAKERIVGRLTVRDDLCTAGGILHGGAYMAFAD